MRIREVSKVIDTALTILLVCFLIIAFIWFIYSFEIFPLPQILENILFSEENGSEYVGEIENKVVELIEDASFFEDEDYNFLVLTPDKANDLLRNFEDVDKYFWEVETSTGTGNSQRNQLHRFYKNGEKIRIDSVDSLSDISSVFAEGVTKIKNNITGEIREISGDTEFNYDNVVSIAALEYLFSDNNTSVQYVSISSADDEEFLYVEVPKLSVKGVDKYFISLKYGIVFAASSYIDDELVFKQNTLSFDSVSIISDETFDIINPKEAT